MNEIDLVLHTPYTVTSADTDMNSRLRLGALVNYLIQSAISSAEKLGFGFSGLREQKLFWVLRNLTVELYRPVMWNETLVVETWPKDLEGVLYLRDFIVRDADRNIVARSTSGWLALDLVTKRPKRFSVEQMDAFTRLKSKHALEYTPIKLSPVEDEKVVGSQIPTFFDIDLNKHVTSTRYIDWMVDTLPLQTLLDHYPTKLTINYLKETMIGEEVVISRKTIAEQSYSFVGVNDKSGMVAFRGQIDYN